MRPKFILTILLPICFVVHVTGQLKWSKALSIVAHNDGGMKPQSNYVEFTDSICVYINFHYPKRDTSYFTLTKSEKDSLVKQMNAAGFADMNSQKRSGIIYDYPETSLTTTVGSKYHRVSISRTESVPDNVSNKFFDLYSYVMGLAQRKTRKPRN